MKVGAIIVSQATSEFLEALMGIRREADVTIAIENRPNSPFVSFETMSETFTFIVNRVPLSYAQNINKGWRMLEGCDAILIANSDIEVPKGWRKALETALENEPEMGAVSLPLDQPLRQGGISKVCPFVFTLVRTVAVTWADVPADEDFVNYGTDIAISYLLHKAGWLHRYVNEGPGVAHHMSSGDKRSFKSGQEHERDAGVFARKFGDPNDFNHP
jgi:GT2 family glycosyltransferase